MSQYISKSALVAEIKKLKCKVSDSSSYCNGWQHALRMLELSLDTFEEKEADFLDWQDIYTILYLERIVQHEFGDHEYSNEGLCQEVLKRFKAQKGE